MDWIFEPSAWASLATLTALETVLGVDNVIFISILASKLPAEQQDKARRIGLILAMVMRLLLLFSLSWIMGLKETLFTVMGHPFSGKDLVLLFGGLFLLYKATTEIHHKLEANDGAENQRIAMSLTSVLVQVMLLDMVFSLDSVITAVGMADHIGVMVCAIIISVGIMLLASKSIYSFVNEHPSVKMLALSFLVLIGATLVAEGTGQHIAKGTVYFAMGFSLVVEMLNLRVKSKAVRLREPFSDPNDTGVSGAAK